MGLSFSVFPCPPVKNLRHEGNQNQDPGGGEGSFPEPGWAMLPICPVPLGWPWLHASCLLHNLGPLPALAAHAFQGAGKPAAPPNSSFQELFVLFPLAEGTGSFHSPRPHWTAAQPCFPPPRSSSGASHSSAGVTQTHQKCGRWGKLSHFTAEETEAWRKRVCSPLLHSLIHSLPLCLGNTSHLQWPWLFVL